MKKNLNELMNEFLELDNYINMNYEYFTIKDYEEHVEKLRELLELIINN